MNAMETHSFAEKYLIDYVKMLPAKKIHGFLVEIGNLVTSVSRSFWAKKKGSIDHSNSGT